MLALGGGSASNCFERAEKTFDGIGWPSSHPVSLTAQAFFVALAGTFSFLRLIRSMYFCWAI
jgi:hypothetical protein